jgi:ubiquinone/menaquinone biosynthesis C-methylase UbiE
MTSLEQTREAWEDSADAYDRLLTATDTQAAEEALRRAGVGPGARLLDIAAGGGALSIPAARVGAEVLAVDFSRAMVQLLERRAERLGLSNLGVRHMDGMALDLPDASFDVAGSVLGIMLFPDRARGLAEMARVLRKGGKGLMLTLGPPPRVEPFGLFLEALLEAVPGFAPPRESPLFCLRDPEVLRRELEAAGFSSVQAEPFAATLAVDSPGALWDPLVAGAPAAEGILEGLPEDRVRAARQVFEEKLRERAGGDRPFTLTVTFNIGIGEK